MVNVPGRSKGCKTCRTRKIKCSLERPGCSQCTKSKRICLGYQRNTIFVNADISTEAHKTRIPGKRQLLGKDTMPTVRLLVKPTPNTQPKMRLDNQCVLSGSAMSLISSSMRQQMLDSLILSPGASDARSWMTFIPSIPSPTKTLETAAQAIALARLSVSLDAPEIRRESIKQYTQSLHHLQRALSHSICGDEILGACMLLAMYEVFECPSNSRVAYHSHFHGCAKLIQLRGPTAYIEGFGHSLFQGFRLMGALEGLRTKSTFLSDEKWMSIPFSKLQKKAPLQTVLDLLLEGSSIIRRAEYLDTIAKEKQIRYAVDLLQDCSSLDGKMQKFVEEFEASTVGNLYSVIPSSKTPMVEGLDYILDDSAGFPDLRTATTLMLSWATLTILWSGMCHLYGFLSQETALTLTPDGKLIGGCIGGSYHFEIPQPTRFKEFPIMARNVLKAVTFCLRDEWGIPATVAPLNMIVDALSSWPGFEKEIMKANQFLDLVERKGMRIVKYIRRQS